MGLTAIGIYKVLRMLEKQELLEVLPGNRIRFQVTGDDPDGASRDFGQADSQAADPGFSRPRG